MLDFNRQRPADVEYATFAQYEPVAVPLRLSSIPRHKALIAASAILFLALGLLYVAWAPKTYTAIARMLLDNRTIQLGQQEAIYARSAVDVPFIQNQLELLRSEKMALKAIEALDLFNNETFNRSGLGLRALVISIAPPLPATAPANPIAPAPAADAPSTGGQPVDPAPSDNARGTFARAMSALLVSVLPESLTQPLSDEERRRQTIEIFKDRLYVGRMGDSYTVEIRFSSRDPRLSADVSNQLAKAYLQDQVETNAQAAQVASMWLRERLRGLGPSARIISEASPPVRPSNPSSASILVAFTVLGLIIGVGLAFARDLFDRALRTPEQIAALTKAECFGGLPLVSLSRWRMRRRNAGSHEKEIDDSNELFAITLRRPLSAFAHTLRRAATAITRDRNQGALSVGVTSSAPGEGKTTLAINLARLLAQMGRRILLVDAVPYDGAISRVIAPGAEGGLLQVLSNEVLLPDAVYRDKISTLHFLPIGSSRTTMYPDTLWPSMDRLIGEASALYDCIVVDLPPLAPTSDVRAAATLLDGFIIVAAWGETRWETLRKGLVTSGVTDRKLIGTVFNRVDVTKLRRFDPVWAATFGGSRYSHYVSDSPKREPRWKLPLLARLKRFGAFQPVGDTKHEPRWRLPRLARLKPKVKS